MNADKTEVCGNGSKYGEIQALSEFKAVNLVTDSILILGCHYSYKKELVINKSRVHFRLNGFSLDSYLYFH